MSRSLFSAHQRAAPRPPAPLTEKDAIDIWIARWLRVRPSELVRRYSCDPRRLYDIWEEQRFAGSRSKAAAVFAARYPTLGVRRDPGPHQRQPLRGQNRDQLNLFAEP